MIGGRTRSREIALQILCSIDGRLTPDPDPCDLVLQMSEARPETKAFARELAEGVLARQDELDACIEATVENWDLNRLAVVDRNILRLAVYEMMACDDIPPTVSINEGIELGKRFSTAQSGAFVNGILDHIRKLLDHDEAQAPASREPDA